MEAAARSETFIFLLLLVSSSCLASPAVGRRDPLAYVPARRRPAVGRGGGAVESECPAMGSRSDCLGRSEWCRWCRSNALDDMCFGSAEAWRLPHQIFSCEAPNA